MDNPFTAAFNPQAPVAERTDALAGLHRAHLPDDTGLLPADAVQELLAWVQEAELAKALVAHPSYAAQHGRAGMQSVGLDEFQARSQGEYWERPLTLTAEGLRSMVTQTPVLNAVILTRTRQVQRFCRICDSDTGLPGFQVGHVDRKHSPSRAELEQMAVLNKVISHCGFEFSARRRKALRRDSFAQLMAKATRDSLVLDAVALELELKNTRDLGIDGLYAVDGATIRLCPEQGYRGDPDIYAVQVVNGQVRTAYRYEELIFEPRNPRSDVASAGYGFPEAELLVRVVTCFLNAMALNSNVFDKNSIPKGVLHLFGNFDSNDVAAFRRYFNNMVRGVNNTLNLPVLVSKDQASKVQFEKFGVDFNEMMFAKWMTFLTSLICAVYGMSPSEINFDSFSGGTASTLGGSDTAEKLAASKDSGLRPLLSYFENLFTDFVVTDFNPDWCFRWTGLDVENPAQRFELRKTVLTLNELRAEEGYQALATPLGEAPVDPALLGAWLHLQEAGADKGLAKSFPHHKGRPGLVGGSLPRGAAADKAADYAQDVKFDFGSANTQWVFKPPFGGVKSGVNGWPLVSGGADDRLKPDGGKGLPGKRSPREGAAACGMGLGFGLRAFPKQGPLKPPFGGGGGGGGGKPGVNGPPPITNGPANAPKPSTVQPPGAPKPPPNNGLSDALKVILHVAIELQNRNTASFAGITDILKDVAKLHPEWLPHGVSRVTSVNYPGIFAVTDSRGLFMLSQEELTNANGRSGLSLITTALKKIKSGETLTFFDEYAMEALWHEIGHNQQANVMSDNMTDEQVIIAESLRETVARQTYPEFLAVFGVRPGYLQAIREAGISYTRSAGTLRNLLLKIGAMDPVSSDITPDVFAGLVKIDRQAQWPRQQTELGDFLAAHYPEYRAFIIDKLQKLAERTYD